MLPPAVRLLVRITVPAAAAAHVLGELADDYARVRQRASRPRARLWLARESLSLAAAYTIERCSAALARLRGGPPLAHDVRVAWRRLRARPLAAAGASIMLSFGLVAALATAGLAQVLLLRPVSAVHGDALHRVTVRTAQGRTGYRLSHAEFRQLQDQLGSSTLLAAASLTPAVLRAGNRDEQGLVEAVDGEYFAALGLRPVAGRPLLASDNAAGAAPVAVVSETYWRRALGGAALAGLTVSVNGAEYAVVGVASASGAGGFVGSNIAAWVPAPASTALLNRGWRDDVTDRAFLGLVLPSDAAATDTALRNADASLRAAHPSEWRERSFRTEPAYVLLGTQQRAAGVLIAILAAFSLLMIVVASANVGGLLLAEAAATHRQVAIHVSLGASRAAIIRRQSLQGALIGLGAGVVALGMYRWIRAQLTDIGLLPTLTLRIDLPWTPELIVLLLAASTTSGVLLALGPAWWSLRLALAEALRDGEMRSVGTAGLSRVRRFLVAAQVCVSMVLLVGAVLFSRSVEERALADLGVARDRLAAFDFDVEPDVPDALALPALAREAVARVAALPGVRGVAMANRAPVDSSTPGADVASAAHSTEVIRDATVNHVTAEYFETVGLPLVRGRGFQASEAAAAPDVAVINETLAARFWPDGDALDRTFVLTPEQRAVRVVGIARDSKYRSIAEPPHPHLYLPTAPSFRLTLLVRTVEDPRCVLRSVQEALSGVGPGVVGFFPRTFEDHLAIDVLPVRAAALAARTLGALGLLLSAAGLYGMVAWFVEIRRREIAVRIALGASARAIERLVAVQALRAALPGLIAGTLVAAAAGHAARSLLFGVRALDPAAFGLAAAALASVVALAAWIPSRRAARTDPAIVLKG